MANILHVCGWFDPSADVTRSVVELNKHSAHKHEVLIKWHHPMKNLLQFPEPEGQSRDNGYVNDKFAWADAIIYHLVGWNNPIGYNLSFAKPCAFRNANVMFNKSTQKFYCLQEFFANPHDSMYEMLASCHMGARDFMGERTAFLPALMPIWDAAYMPDWTERDHCIAYLKHDEEIARRLWNGNNTPGNLSLTNRPHADVMEMRRKHATIVIDNVGEGHYGLAGTEAMAQGIPAIAWNHPRTIEQLADIAPTGGNPFIQAEDVRTAVKHATQWPGNTAQEYGRVCRNWIETYYDSRYLIERYWEPFCNELVKK